MDVVFVVKYLLCYQRQVWALFLLVIRPCKILTTWADSNTIKLEKLVYINLVTNQGLQKATHIEEMAKTLCFNQLLYNCIQFISGFMAFGGKYRLLLEGKSHQKQWRARFFLSTMEKYGSDQTDFLPLATVHKADDTYSGKSHQNRFLKKKEIMKRFASRENTLKRRQSCEGFIPKGFFAHSFLYLESSIDFIARRTFGMHVCASGRLRTKNCGKIPCITQEMGQYSEVGGTECRKS